MAQKYIALISCAGKGLRFGGEVPKQYHTILDKTVLEYTLEAFINVRLIDEIVVIVSPDDDMVDGIVGKLNNPRVRVSKVGGKSRAETILNGLNELDSVITNRLDENDWVMVHDAVRCCITPLLIEKQIEELKNHPVGGILAISAVDTIKYVSDNTIMNTLDRSKIFLAQTPQMFRFGLLKTALAQVDLELATDESFAVESFLVNMLKQIQDPKKWDLNMNEHTVKVVLGDASNIKITMQDDLEKAKLIILENSIKSY